MLTELSTEARSPWTGAAPRGGRVVGVQPLRGSHGGLSAARSVQQVASEGGKRRFP